MTSSVPLIKVDTAASSNIEKELEDISVDFGVECVPSDFNVRQYIDYKIEASCLEDPFYVVDVGVVKKRLCQWRQELPRVEPFYAMKCNPHPAIVRTLRALGIGFDCASKAEIQTIVEELRVHPSKVIFANPCKPPTHLQYARARGVELMTFDNAPELEKIKKHYPNAKLVLRILTDDSSSICRFGSKFGAPPQHIPVLLEKVNKLGLKLVGVSFHVGSGCLSTIAFVDAVRRAHRVFQQVKEMGMAPLTLLDIGGGFPGSSDTGPHPAFKDIAAALRPALDECFPPESGIHIIAEPGRFFAAETHTLAVCVYARRDVEMEMIQDAKNAEEQKPTAAVETLPEDESLSKPDYLYYVNDGVYGSFNCLFFDHAKVNPLPVRALREGETTWRSTIFGPTCDSLDCIAKNEMLPKMEVGDWLYFKEMGAYTIAAASKFNGFSHPDMFFVDSFTKEGVS